MPDETNNPSQNTDDFFYDFIMESSPGGFWNRVDDTFSGGEATLNVRLTGNGAYDGPMNREGILGTWCFTVAQGATPGQYSFDSNDVEVFDSTLTKIWNSDDVGSGVTEVHNSFNIVAPPPICGDGNIEGLEECDDNNTSDGDGCSSTCTVEDGWDCSGEPSVCAEICGDGLVVGAEACDDGYTDACGTCDATCSGVGSGSTCGDGEVCPETETCDDGYADACGTCNAGCTGPGTGSTCGDSAVCPESEDCDDNNTDNGDGCSSTCTVEDGWDCSGDPSVCTTTCGDALIVGAEQCDDNNPDDGDGCSSTCTIEDGWSCAGEPSVCMPAGIPTVSQWGLIVMSLLVLTAGTLVYTRRSPTHAWALSRRGR